MAVGFPAKTNFATGEVLTATNMNDITGTLNLLQSSLFTAGQNKIINGDFNVNQRAFTSTTSASYGFDRWTLVLSGGTATYSAQTFTAGDAPVAGYEAKNFARVVATVGNDYCRLDQRIESVRTLAGQTVTVSFWAKGTNPATLGSLNVTMVQSFGSGGSPSASVIQNFGSFVLTANWTRYTVTGTVPSISGKTIGTNNDDNIGFSFGQGASTSTESWTLDLWGVQVEPGSTASPFQTASGSIGGELALCQRYYFRAGGTNSAERLGFGSATNATEVQAIIPLKTSMRIAPSAVDFSGLQVFDGATTTAISAVTLTTAAQGKEYGCISCVSTGLTQFRPYQITNTSTAGYLAFSAEF
jgi:hypothetical protein